jgi:hypothetical protein
LILFIAKQTLFKKGEEAMEKGKKKYVFVFHFKNLEARICQSH